VQGHNRAKGEGGRLSDSQFCVTCIATLETVLED
jgi:hypothetical protein